MSNIFKCLRYNTILIQEEFDSHICTPRLKDMKQFEFDYYDVIKDGLNREVITIKSMDGTYFRFVKREMEDSDKTIYLPPKRQYPNFTPDDSTEPKITKLQLNNWIK